MLKHTLAVAALAALIPTLASAANVTGTVTVNGSVAGRCQFTLGSATITIPELSDTSTGVLDASTVNGRNVALTGWCNGATSNMAVEAQPLLNATAAPAGFTNRVDYTATATAHPAAGNVSANDTTTVAGPGTGVPVGVFSSDIDVALSSASSTGAKLIAGAYTGQVLVTLTPGI